MLSLLCASPSVTPALEDADVAAPTEFEAEFESEFEIEFEAEFGSEFEPPSKYTPSPSGPLWHCMQFIFESKLSSPEATL
jgi:hypothetical protein